MSPTIALKCRLNRARRLEGRMPFMTIPSGIRKISIGSSAELDSAHVDPTTTEDSAVQLLLSISSIVSNEVNSNGFSFDEEDNGMSKDDGSETEVSKYLLTPRGTCQSPLHTSDDNINRLRSVSIDSFSYRPQSPTVPSTKRTLGGSPLSARPVLISPTSTPVGRTRPVRRTTLKLTQKAKREHLKLPKIPHAPVLTAKVKDYKKKALSTSISKGRKLKVIGRKKFSWKNYPELEAFLVANREEYLRHSALNYTIQQKQYNNRLTEQLLELAADHGYAFDEVEFSFVTVRDRIRCYFKSYVQSAKKRGITVGYAARKAGLLTEDDLHVEKEGEIVVPEGF